MPSKSSLNEYKPYILAFMLAGGASTGAGVSMLSVDDDRVIREIRAFQYEIINEIRLRCN